MASTRCKSCTACVASKRRCSLALPSCQRCTDRGINCKYPWAAALEELGGVGDALIQSSASPPWQFAPIMDDPWLNTTLYRSVQLPLSPASSIPAPMVPGMLSQISEFSEQTHVNQVFNLVPSAAARFETPPLSATLNPDLLDDSEPEGHITSGSQFQERSEYAGRRLANQPLVLAQLGHTAFIHHTQVSASEALQDALAACALHAMRNAINAALVRSEIARRAARLVASLRAALAGAARDDAQGQEGGGDGRATTHLLPALQALLVYQCIRLFGDSDIGQRAQAERDAGVVRALVSALLGVWPRFGEARSGDGWAPWVRDESVRRTVLVAELLVGTYAFLKQGWDQADARVLRLGYTAQIALWEARSAAEWEVLWDGKARLEVTISNWEESMALAVPDDVDELGILIRAMYLGLEAVENWLGWQRNALVRWGLRSST
jgi:hypothetical protein